MLFARGLTWSEIWARSRALRSGRRTRGSSPQARARSSCSGSRSDAGAAGERFEIAVLGLYGVNDGDMPTHGPGREGHGYLVSRSSLPGIPGGGRVSAKQ